MTVQCNGEQFSGIISEFNVQFGAGQHLKFGLASLSGARRGYMPSQLKTNKTIFKTVCDKLWIMESAGPP